MFYAVREKLRKTNHCLSVFYLFSLFFLAIPIVIISIKAFHVSPNHSFHDHLAFANSLLFVSILRSIAVAIVTLVFVVGIAYPFAYFLFNVKSPGMKVVIVALITSPIWSTFFVKLIGLKSFFDFCNGEVNSTRGLVYVVIGLVYMNLPASILAFYTGIMHIPKNIINSSMDLGRNKVESMFSVIIPYTYKSIISVVFLVFLPSVTSVSIPDFLNKSSGSKMISQILGSLVQSDDNSIGINRLSFLIFVLVFFGVVGYLVIKNWSQVIRALWLRRHA